MVSVPARRWQVAYGREHGLSARRACTLFSVARSALSYQGRKTTKDAPVVERMKVFRRSIRATTIDAFGSFFRAPARCSTVPHGTNGASNGKPSQANGGPKNQGRSRWQTSLRTQRFGPFMILRTGTLGPDFLAERRNATAILRSTASVISPSASGTKSSITAVSPRVMTSSLGISWPRYTWFRLSSCSTEDTP